MSLKCDDLSFLNFDLEKKSYKNPIFALEILCHINENFSPVLRQYWGDVIFNPIEWFKSAQDRALELGASFVSIYFNSQEPQEYEKLTLLEKYKDILLKIQDAAKVPLMIKLSSHEAWDCELAKILIPLLKKSCIISPIQAANYKLILSAAKNSPIKHYFVLRTPIDINLTKELNILSIDEGLSADRILIDPDMGCIGYGIDYGYSIIERICLARTEGDNMLNMPIIVFAGEESYKAKETKSTDFAASWGELDLRARCWEVSTASSLVCAGANIAVLWNPQTLEVLKEQYCEAL